MAVRRDLHGNSAPADRHIHLNGGFQPARSTIRVRCGRSGIAGLGFAAIRDFASYAKHRPDSIAPAARVYGEGISQNGRFLRDSSMKGSTATRRQTRVGRCSRARRGRRPRQFQLSVRAALADAQPTSSVTFQPMFSPSPIFPKPIRLPASAPACSIGRRPRRSCRKSFSRTRPTSIGGGPRRSFPSMRRASRCPAVRQCQDLSLHRTTTFFPAFAAAQGRWRSPRAEAESALPSSISGERCLPTWMRGAERHHAATQQLSADRQWDARPLRGMRFRRFRSRSKSSRAPHASSTTDAARGLDTAGSRSGHNCVLPTKLRPRLADSAVRTEPCAQACVPRHIS